MKTILKFVITALIITSLAITTISAIDSADSTQYNTLDQTKNFLIKRNWARSNKIFTHPFALSIKV